MFTQKQIKKLALTGCLAAGLPISASAQITITQTLGPGDTLEVTGDISTSVQVASGNAVELPAGGTVNNGVGGIILGDPNAVIANGPATVSNAGSITGAFNGVNFATGSSGTLTNFAGGVISSDSRAVNIDGLAGNFVLTNFGDILGTGDQRNGTVYSDADATDFDTINAGTIDAGAGNQGSGVAWEIEGLNTATLTNSGLIQGRTNTPGIAGSSPLSGDGVRLNNFTPDTGAPRVYAGTIVNQVGGVFASESLSGPIAGFRSANTVDFQGTLINEGLITGAANGAYFGTGDHTGGVVNNSGVISSDSRAFNLDGSGLTVINSGSILGTGNQRNGTFYADGTADDFTVTNQSGGVIDAGAGNTGSGFAAEVGSAADGANTFVLNNAGTIQGRGDAPAAENAAGDGVRIGNVGNIGTAEATIINSGTIASEGANGTVAGVRFVNGVSFSGELINTGTISGVANGVYFGNPVGGQGADHSGGVVNNSGLISSDSRAFNLDGIGLTLNNSGDILGTGNQRNGTFYADGGADDYEVNNLLGGVIDAGEGNTGSGFGVEIGSAVDGANTFTLNNAGTIQGRGDAPAAENAAGDGVRIGNVGNIGIAEATITNSGTIASEGANGTVAGVRFVNGISFAGELNNSGTITGVQNGVYFGNPVGGQGADHSNGVVNNTGTISSDSRAFNLDGIGLTLNNAGDILGTGNQRNGTFYADGGADDYEVNNSGTIDAGEGNTGSGFGVEVGSAVDGANTFVLSNSGTIQGRGNAPAAENAAGDGVRIGNVGNIGAAEVTLTNSGTIASEGTNGTVAGVRFVNGISFAGELNNTGTITGIQNGVYFGNPVGGQGADHSNGVVNNSGTISSQSRAFNLDGIGLTVNNSGDILALGAQRNGTFYLDGTATGFEVNNLAGGSIDARGGSGSGISLQVGNSSPEVTVQTGSFSNAGLIAGAGGGPLDAGVRFFDGNGALDSTFQGDLVNELSGLITADKGSDAILVQDGVDFDGAVINEGTIDGSIDLATGDLDLEATSLLVLDVVSLTDAETVTLGAGDLDFGGTLEVIFHNGFLPTVGDQFDLFDVGGVSTGGFDSITSNVGAQFDTSLLLSDGILQITAVGVPEPGTGVLLIGLLGLAGVARRR